MTLTKLKEITGQIQCQIGGIAWQIHCAEMGNGFYVQLRYIEPDVETGDPEDQHGRKWYVSSHSTKSEVVQTVFKACMTSAEHMTREHFTYRGVRIFGPHFDVDQLADLCSTGAESRDVRSPAYTSADLK